MPTIKTLGSENRRTEFSYTGNVADGVWLELSGRPRISAAFFRAILDAFSGQTIPGGFSMTDPTPGGLGEWVRDNSRRLNDVVLSPRHASFIAAVLVHEGYADSELRGNAVYISFHPDQLRAIINLMVYK